MSNRDKPIEKVNSDQQASLQVQASDEILRIVCFAAVKGSNAEGAEVLMTLGPSGPRWVFGKHWLLTCG